MKTLKPRSYRTTKSEKALLEPLMRQYHLPDHMVLRQVRIPVHGSGRIRTADALVVGLWESRDACFRGYEMKGSRSGWLDELKRPEKADEVAQFCDYWSILALPDAVKESEVTAPWGLYVLKRGALEPIREPQRLSPKEPTRALLGSVLQAVFDQVRGQINDIETTRAHQAGMFEGKRQATEAFKTALESTQERLHETKDEILRLKEFIRHLGLDVHLHRESGDDLERIKTVFGAIQGGIHSVFGMEHEKSMTEKFLEAVEFVRNGGFETYRGRLSSLQKTVRDILQEVDHRIALLEGLGQNGHP